ncbi:MAG: hypothetical protein ACTHJZ_22040 [Trinickia sp.]|uniref:hypothetical protein n=1 Tax=Trinickia sp. TaxID=2571163 RepID=UPI003F812F56
MSIRAWAGAVLIATTSGLVWAQRPLVYPLRSQSPGAQSVDNAFCYWQAKQQTNVDIAREPQRPLRTKAIEFTPDAGRGTSVPPLPPGTYRAKAASGGAAAASAASPATVASQATPASSATSVGASGASQTAALNAASGASSVNLPPLPPPEPPMTRYWQAYGDCMQSRGYGVR